MSETEKSALSKGFNYAIAPKTIPTEEIIASIESTLSSVDVQSAEPIRLDTARILQSARPPKPNLRPSELQGLKALKKNENIIILPADKGNATVVMDTADYKRKMYDILEDGTYKQTNRDPTTYLEKTTRTKIN